ncbi:phage/plasmid primase, P4 family [Corynebacterium qintianiae]|uniref:DNA primase family protein n=1 Tax=Corynebacterium qintianiae TaxID=2709392 RepID=UPI0013EBB195|nr:phage/plasmid primase, P4 family [Corynebacterium qintianiae]
MQQPPNTAPWPNHARPLDTAERVIADIFSTDGAPTLAWWQDTWWQYTGTHWQEADELAVKEPVWRVLQAAMMEQSKDEEPRPWNPTTARINNLIEPLRIAALRPGTQQPPLWLPRRADDPEPTRVVPVNNGLYLTDTAELIPHTPEHFQTWALPFNHDPHAECPRWQSFLADTFKHDPNGLLALQEYAGYIVSGQTNLHKALLLVGPRRGGKGTISRILQQLQGTGNVAATTFSDLSNDFGLAALIGKPLAVIEDARGADHLRHGNRATERLLNIIGEDTITANRKNKPYYVGRLPARFVIVSNETPRFNDPSGAIVSRFLAVRLVSSVPDDKRDPHLGAKLTAELPGILNWALEGLRRLEQQGRFTTPNTQPDVLDIMQAMASPLEDFFDESEFVVTNNPEHYVELSTVFQEYKRYTAEAGQQPAGRPVFEQRIQAAFPGVTIKNTRRNGEPKKRWLFGITERQ